MKTFADLILKPSEEDLKIWPHRFEFRLRVALGPGGDLTLTSRIRNINTDGRPFSFTFAYHTYFSVSDIRSVCFLNNFLPFFSKLSIQTL
uniref:Glucose-6-phosphate 1-epimerase n=1 Tax=Arundo donax TaxID=35708 RepID=A0A0A9G1W4_ARUDO